MTQVKEFIEKIQKDTPVLELVKPRITLKDDCWTVFHARVLDVEVKDSGAEAFNGVSTSGIVIEFRDCNAIEKLIDTIWEDVLPLYCNQTTRDDLHITLEFLNSHKKTITERHLSCIRTERFFDDVKVINGEGLIKFSVGVVLLFKGAEYAPLESFFDEETNKIIDDCSLQILLPVHVDNPYGEHVFYLDWLDSIKKQ